MAAEIRERSGVRYLSNLISRIERCGFKPDLDLEKCRARGYLRGEIEPFLAKLKKGEVSLDVPRPQNGVALETMRILRTAQRPVETKEIVGKIRRKMTLGPSDRLHFFFRTMHKEKRTFVYLVGAGWWLRDRSFMGRAFPLGPKPPSYQDMVGEEMVAILRKAKRPEIR